MVAPDDVSLDDVGMLKDLHATPDRFVRFNSAHHFQLVVRDEIVAQDQHFLSGLRIDASPERILVISNDLVVDDPVVDDLAARFH